MNVDDLRERITGAFRSVFAPQHPGEMVPQAPVDERGAGEGVVDTSDAADALMPLSEARAIVRDVSREVSNKTNFVAMVLASHVICESGEATLDDLLACASAPFSSAAWRPTQLLHERLDVPKCFDGSGSIIRDPDFWGEQLSRLAPIARKCERLPLPAAAPMWSLAEWKIQRPELRALLGPPHFVETDSTRTFGGEEDGWAFTLPSGQRVLVILRVPYHVAILHSDPPMLPPILEAIGLASDDPRLMAYPEPYAQ